MLNCTIERELAFLIERELEYHLQIENLKRELMHRFDWSNQNAFYTVDVHKDNFLTYESIL